MVVTELPHGVSVKLIMEEIEALANPKALGNKKEVSQEQRRMKQFILDQVEGVRDESDRKSKLRLVIEPRTSKQDPEELMAALSKIGDTITAEWLKAAGADGEAIVKAYKGK